ncbi:MAG: hypothetical protein ABIS50_13565 [Luteolibacter sp.]|uniref:hypothetical protein n=1 Tax=Luteolibacter sp. TaxID=1962973 RepID=UPI00326613A1
MNWIRWSRFSVFSPQTTIRAKIGVPEVDSNLTKVVPEAVILVFAWANAFDLINFATKRGWVAKFSCESREKS